MMEVRKRDQKALLKLSNAGKIDLSDPMIMREYQPITGAASQTQGTAFAAVSTSEI